MPDFITKKSSFVLDKKNRNIICCAVVQIVIGNVRLEMFVYPKNGVAIECHSKCIPAIIYRIYMELCKCFVEFIYIETKMRTEK